MTTSVQDVDDDLQSLQQRQAAVLTLGRRAAASPSERVLLRDAAMLLGETLTTSHAALAVHLDEEQLLHQVFNIADGPDAEPAGEQRGRARADRSLPAYASAAAHPLIVTDLATETRFQDPWLLQRGVRSALCLPLATADRAFGALAVYSDQPNQFGEDEAAFAESISHLVTNGVSRAEAENALAEERRLQEATLGAVEAVVIVLSAEGAIVRTNPFCARISGFAAEEIRGRTFWNTFVAAGDQDHFHALFEKLTQQRTPAELESHLLTKHGDRRRLRWRFVVLGGGGASQIVGTGVDVTELAHAQSRLQHVEALVRNVASGESAFSALQDEFSDRRSKPRRAFPFLQMIGPVVDGRLPTPGEYRQVRCRDIGAGGFSFVAPAPVEYTQLVVALGIEGSVTRLLANVVHMTKLKQEGRVSYQIGCRYLRRVTDDEQ